jgi:hypothetical protein
MNTRLTLLLLIVSTALVACEQEPAFYKNVPRTSNELLYNDVLAHPFSSRNTTVLGVSVGMTSEDVRTRIGEPDKVEQYSFGSIQNWHYSAAVGLNSTGVLYHFEDGTVTRITISPAMNKYLKGNSTVGKQKEDIYSVLGAPDRIYDIPRARFLVYNDEGFETYLNRYGEYQYAFVYPMRKLPTMAYETKNKTNEEILEIELPVLLTDTTTLCDQGTTYARNPATNECKRYENACTIPANWIETTTCNSTVNQTR